MTAKPIVTLSALFLLLFWRPVMIQLLVKGWWTGNKSSVRTLPGFALSSFRQFPRFCV